MNPASIFSEALVLWNEATALVQALPPGVKARVPALVQKIFAGAIPNDASAGIARTLGKAADAAVNVAVLATADDATADATAIAWCDRVLAALTDAVAAQKAFIPFQRAVTRAEQAHGDVGAAQAARKGPQAARNAAFGAALRSVFGK